MAENYYVILGVAGDASPEEIKAAYRRQVKRLHPDYYGEDREPFLAIQEAYDVLSDPERRQAYDDTLAEQRRQKEKIRIKSEPARPRQAAVEPLIPTDEWVDLRGTSSERFFEPAFERMLEWFSGGFERGWPQVERTVLTVEVSLRSEQARRGGRLEISIPVQGYCPVCRGYGQVGFWICRRCGGEGVVVEAKPVLVSFPAGMSDGEKARVSLARLGYEGNLEIRFRVGEDNSGWKKGTDF